MPSKNNPASRVMKFTILLHPSLVFITIYLICLIRNRVYTRRGEEKMIYVATP